MFQSTIVMFLANMTLAVLDITVMSPCIGSYLETEYGSSRSEDPDAISGSDRINRIRNEYIRRTAQVRCVGD